MRIFLYSLMTVLILSLFTFPQGRVRGSDQSQTDLIEQQLKKEASEEREEEFSEEREEESQEKIDYEKQKEEVLKEVEEVDRQLEASKNTPQAEAIPQKISVKTDNQIVREKKIPVGKVLIKQFDIFMKRLQRDLEKTSKLDLFEINQDGLDQIDGETISLINPKPLKDQTEGEFQRLLAERKLEARKNSIKAKVVSLNVSRDISDEIIPYIYESISSRTFYTRYPQEIDFVNCYQCITGSSLGVVRSDSGGVSIGKNQMDMDTIKSLTRKYKLDIYVKVSLIFRNKELIAQVDFYNAKSHRLIWSGRYNYYLPSLSGSKFTMEVGSSIWLGAGSIYSNNLPLSGNFVFGAQYYRVGSFGTRFNISGGFDGNYRIPSLFLINAYYDFAFTDYIVNYSNVVVGYFGVDMGLGIQTITFENSVAFFNMSPYFKISFIQVAYLRVGVIIDVTTKSEGGVNKILANDLLKTGFFFDFGAIFL